MVGLEKYHAVTKDFLEALREDGRDLCISNMALHIYYEGAWTAVVDERQMELDRLLRKVADEVQFPYAEKTQQLWRHIKTEIPIIHADKMDQSGLIALPNGRTLDPYTGRTHDHSPEHCITRRVMIDYDPKAECPEWLAMLDRAFDDEERSAEVKQEYIDFLQVWFGLALVGYARFGRPYRRMLFLYGPPGTGKSAVAGVLTRILGDDNVVSDSVEQISSQYGLASVMGSIAIISDDGIGIKTKIATERFKALVTGEKVSVNRKYMNNVQFRFQGPILFTTNSLPNVSDSTNALYSRATVLQMTRVFDEEDAKRDLGGEKDAAVYLDKIGEFPGILNWALEGLKKVKKMKGLPTVSESNDVADLWRQENDPVYAFLKKYCSHEPGITNYPLPVAAAVSVYAETQQGSREYPTSRASGIIGRTVQDVVPGVRRQRAMLWKEQTRCYSGLLINDEGLKYVHLAREKGLLPTEYPVNERELGSEPKPKLLKVKQPSPSKKKNGQQPHVV